MKTARHQFSILKQICELIPGHLVPKLAREHGVDKKCRTFDPWSHVVSLIHAQIAHSMSLNDVCDTLQNHSGVLTTIRKAVPPSRNGLSHANNNRNADMAEDLFWQTLDHLCKAFPRFGRDHGYCGLPRRFKRGVKAVDSTTVRLVANCIDWAKHRRRKAGVKCHVRLDLQTFMPNVIIIREAKKHDSTFSKELCAGLRDGEVVVWDKAYNDFAHLFSLAERGVFWVNRAKENMTFDVVREISEPNERIIRDVSIRLKGQRTSLEYPEEIRLVEALVKVKKKSVRMTFVTNNFQWSASSICELYKARWGIEVFFKMIKQNLQIADFLGNSENAVRWQMWTAMLTYLLLRFIEFISKWKKPFSRLFTLVRGVMWSCLDLFSLVEFYGTAGVRIRMRAAPEQAYLPGLSP